MNQEKTAARFCPKCQSDQERYADGKCKECRRALARKWYASNTEKVLAAKAAYTLKNVEKLKAKWANYRANNLEKVKARDAAYYKKSREKILIGKSEYHLRNLDSIRAKHSEYARKNPEKFRVWGNNRRARKLAAGGKLSVGLAARLFAVQKGLCACCRMPLGDNYHLDHIMPLALGGTNTDDNMQLLRQRCNLQKRAKHPVDFMQSRGFLL